MSAQSDIISPTTAASGRAGPESNARKFLLAGIVFIVISLIGLFFGGQEDPARPFIGWIVGISFWLSICIGMLFLLMIWWMFDAGWPVIIRRQLEHALSAIPWIGLIFLPLVILSLFANDGGPVAWIWMQANAPVPGGHGTVDHDVLYLSKAPYLNVAFFVFRVVLYFGIWAGLAAAFRRWSFAMDETGDHKYVHYSRMLSAAGLFLCAFATTFAAIDWFKSLNYHWFSTMYGVWFFSASMRAALSATVIILLYKATKPDGLKGIVKDSHFYLMGCLMLAFTVFWAYISFSQYFLIYNANIPEETFWYNMREIGADGMKNSWWWVSMGLIFMHFFFPFLWLLWYKNKFRMRILFISVWILVFHLLDLYWNIVPQKLPEENVLGYVTRPFGIHLIDITMFAGVGAIAIWAYLRSCNRYRPIPIRDPRIQESISYHE